MNDYGDYFRLLKRDLMALRGHRCTSCATAGIDRPAIAVWKHPNGNVSLLCESSLRNWRQFAEEDPDLAAESVYDIDEVSIHARLVDNQLRVEVT